MTVFMQSETLSVCGVTPSMEDFLFFFKLLEYLTSSTANHDSVLCVLNVYNKVFVNGN